MNPSPPEDANREYDPAAYADGDPDAVRAGEPREPSDSEWEAVRLRIHARLAAHNPADPVRFRRRAFWLAAGVALTATATAVAWVVFNPKVAESPLAPELVEAKPMPLADALPVAPLPHEGRSDPLAEFAVLPMATDDEVVLHRVPGDGVLPVGTHPLPGTISLATTEEVQLDEPNPAWPSVIIAPGSAPMIFAAKPR